MSTLSTRFRAAQQSYRPAPSARNRAKNKAKTDWREDQVMIFRHQLWDYSNTNEYSRDDVDFLANLEHDIRLLESELEDIRSGLFAEMA